LLLVSRILQIDFLEHVLLQGNSAVLERQFRAVRRWPGYLISVRLRLGRLGLLRMLPLVVRVGATHLSGGPLRQITCSFRANRALLGNLLLNDILKSVLALVVDTIVSEIVRLRRLDVEGRSLQRSFLRAYSLDILVIEGGCDFDG